MASNILLTIDCDLAGGAVEVGVVVCVVGCVGGAVVTGGFMSVDSGILLPSEDICNLIK